MSCPDPYRPYNPFESAPDPDPEPRLYDSLPSDADIRGLTSALAASGGGASSEDLALDLVLNQIVEQACLATGATGAAIALTRDGEMVCRATTGKTAPDLGVRLDNAGFSAECLRVGMLQRCDDTETDPRVDASACRLLGVRSILVVPLWYWGEFMGIFEIFSPRPNAFGERDEQTLQALAYRIVRHTKQTSGELTGFASPGEETAPLEAPIQVAPAQPPRDEPLPPPKKPRAVPDTEPLRETVRPAARERMRVPIFELKPPAKAPASASDPVTTMFAAFAAIIACLILGLMVYRVSNSPTSAQKAPPSAPAAAQPQELDLTLGQAPPSSDTSVAQAASPQDAKQDGSATRKPESGSAADVVVSAGKKDHSPSTDGGGLAIYDEKGKLIYGSPIHSDDETATKPKKSSARPASSAASPMSQSRQPTTGNAAAGSVAAGTAASVVKSAAARTKISAAENPVASAAGASLTEGRYVRLKPDLAENLLDERVEPDYPDAARRAHIQGSVILETLIGANGKVQETIPVSGPPQLAEAAANAVRQWKYKPFTVDGQKTPIRTQVTVTFMLAQ